MGSYQNILKDGGRILLAGGSSKGQYPQDLIVSDKVIIWTDDDFKMGAYRPIPVDVKGVLINRAISHKVAHMILGQARERKLFILPGVSRSTSEAVKAARDIINANPVEVKIASPIDESILEEIMPTEKGDMVERDGKSIQPRGATKSFVEKNVELKSSRTVSEEARRLFDIAQKEGFKTTVASIEQTIRSLKRGKGIGAIPESIAKARKTEPAWKTAIRDVDNAIASLELMREQIETLAKENEELRAFKENFQKKFRELFGEM